mgnify:CR=1 FL=1
MLKIEQKRYEEAIKVYEQAIALEPLNPNPLVNLAWVKQTLGISTGSSQMVRDAEELYEKSLRIKPTSEAFMRLGKQWALVRARDPVYKFFSTKDRLRDWFFNPELKI